MKLSQDSLERAKMRERQTQLELPNMPSPMTENRAKDFASECKSCGVVCDYCLDPLGR